MGLLDIPFDRIDEMDLSKSDLQAIIESYQTNRDKIKPEQGERIRAIIEYWVSRLEIFETMEETQSEIKNIQEKEKFDKWFPPAPKHKPSAEIFQLNKDLKSFENGKERITRVLRAVHKKYKIHPSWIEYVQACIEGDIEATKKRIKNIKRKRKGGGLKKMNVAI